MSIIVVAGRFSKDGELRYTQDGKAVLSFSIAENVYTNGKQEAQFFNCTLFGQRAEKLHPYLKKGDAATVYGVLNIDKYTATLTPTQIKATTHRLHRPNSKRDRPYSPKTTSAATYPFKKAAK